MKNGNVVFPVIIFQIRGVYNYNPMFERCAVPVNTFQIPGVYNRDYVVELVALPVAAFQIPGVYNRLSLILDYI